MKELIPICPNCGGEVIEKKVEKLVKGATSEYRIIGHTYAYNEAFA
ncbi:MAG: hypothetical protein WC556_08710 [Candidatus Methanoperedens sp.]